MTYKTDQRLKWDEIRKGHKIRVVYTEGTVTHTLEGTVGSLSGQIAWSISREGGSYDSRLARKEDVVDGKTKVYYTGYLSPEEPAQPGAFVRFSWYGEPLVAVLVNPERDFPWSIYANEDFDDFNWSEITSEQDVEILSNGYDLTTF